jgi:integrase
MVMSPTLTDDIGMPRFWASVWVLFAGSSLVSSTLGTQLKDIEAFYSHTDSTRAIGALDDAIGRLELPLIEEMLEAYSLELRSQSKGATTKGRRWRHSFAFVKDICERIARIPASTARLEDLRLHIERLDRLFGDFFQRQKGKNTYIRALPAAVLDELYAAVTPGSPTNPFKSDAAQWRVYATFSLLLHEGLRRGEALSMRWRFC